MKKSGVSRLRFVTAGLIALLGLAPLGLHAQPTNSDSTTPGTNAPDQVPATAPYTATVPASGDMSAPAAPSSDSAPAPDTSQVNPAAPSGMAQTQPPPQEEIKDIRPPFYFIRSLFWLWIVLGAIVTTGLLALCWYWFKPHRQLSAKTAYELTLDKLEQARALLQEDNPMPYAVFVSETIRTYLGQRFRTPSTRRTTEEFLRLMETNEGAPLADHRDLLRHFLQSCDLVKFARYQPTLAELEEVQQRAVGFVTATKPQSGAMQGVPA